jgi:hypothetical protein
MSKINGDKARDAKRRRKQGKQRVKNQSLRDMYVLPLKTTLRPDPAKAKAPKTAAEKKTVEKKTAEKKSS